MTYEQLRDGGPAFPWSAFMTGENTYQPITQGGMSLRDWFAGQALQRLIGSADADNVALEAYRYADAMLVVRAALAGATRHD